MSYGVLSCFHCSFDISFVLSSIIFLILIPSHAPRRARATPHPSPPKILFLPFQIGGLLPHTGPTIVHFLPFTLFMIFSTT